MLNQKQKSFYFFARERPQNCNVINWVINYGSSNAQLQLITLFMLLDGHFDAYVYTLR